MPRPPESRVRRLMMQGIMWVILLGMMGAAMAVDARLRRLDKEVSFGPIALNVSSRWEIERTRSHELRLTERDERRKLVIRRDAPVLSLSALFEESEVIETTQMPLSDGSMAPVSVVRKLTNRAGLYFIEIVASVQPPGGKPVLITLEQFSAGNSEVKPGLKLMQRILATVRFREDQPSLSAPDP